MRRSVPPFCFLLEKLRREKEGERRGYGVGGKGGRSPKRGRERLREWNGDKIKAACASNKSLPHKQISSLPLGGARGFPVPSGKSSPRGAATGAQHLSAQKEQGLLSSLPGSVWQGPSHSMAPRLGLACLF